MDEKAFAKEYNNASGTEAVAGKVADAIGAAQADPVDQSFPENQFKSAPNSKKCVIL